MQKRQIKVGLMGMNQDIINPKVNSQQAYEIKNFRINPTANSNGIELTSEKGTLQVEINDPVDGGSYSSIFQFIRNYPDYEEYDYPYLDYSFSTVGYCVFNQYVVIFAHGRFVSNEIDAIIRLEIIENGSVPEIDKIYGRYLYFGHLGFDADHIIETVTCFESEKIKKVYWIDGKNYPRVINIERTHGAEDELGYLDFGIDEDPFSFYQKISQGSYNYITVGKGHVGGLFYAGVIQYAFSFYNLNAQETPVIYTTPLNYISHEDRGELPNKQLGCSFNVRLDINADDAENFDYIRVYSIYRTSINGTPLVKVIKDIKCDQLIPDADPPTYYSVKFTDTNEGGYDFDAYKILISNDHIKPNAIAHKDVKLFLANYSSDSIPDYPFASGFAPSSVIIDWVVSNERIVKMHDTGDIVLYPYENQNNEDSRTIRTFKKGEYYKFGVLFQDNYGNWSTPYYFNKSENDQFPVQASGWVLLPYALTSGFTVADLYTQLKPEKQSQFTKVRPVVSCPTESERLILCQGVINPTVFNCGQRHNNICHTQSSWFFRPFRPDNNSIDELAQYQRNVGFVRSEHMMPLLGSDKEGGELLNMYFDDEAEYWYSNSDHPIGLANTTIQLFVDNLKVRHKRNIKYTSLDLEENDFEIYDSFYYVDQNMVTLNSPDIEFNDNISNVDLSQYKLRIVGKANFTNSASKYNIIATNPLFMNIQRTNKSDWGADANYYSRSNKLSDGFYDRSFVYFNPSASSWQDRPHGGAMLSNGIFWFDDVCNIFTFKKFEIQGVWNGWNSWHQQYGYAVYPWQRQYLNNYSGNRYNPIGLDESGDAGITSESESARIIRKVLSNLRYTYTDYDLPSGFSSDIDTKEIRVYNSNEALVSRFQDGNLYYGNVDQMVTCSSNYIGSQFIYHKDLGSGDDQVNWGIREITGYPIIVGKVKYTQNMWSTTGDTSIYTVKDGSLSNSYSGAYWDPAYAPSGSDVMYHNFKPINIGLITEVASGSTAVTGGVTPNDYTQDPIMIRYKSAPHIICECASGVTISKIKNDNDFEHGYLYVGEIYRDASGSTMVTDETKFGLQSRTWLPCGPEEQLASSNTNPIKWMEGDTFFQRYDCLKTYPFSNDDYQSVVEIGSFMLETHVNLDGRYDLNRGLVDNTFINPTNFNLINDVYSLSNNFFQYNILDPERFNVDTFPTRLTWSLNKINNQEIDEWTRTNTAAFMDLDGDKGLISSLRRFSNQIYAFQEQGISRIKYNENVAINASNGTPIELGNSNSVNGKDYISEAVGSQNKWSCVSTPSGIFFVDNKTPGIYRLGYSDRGISLESISENVLQRYVETENNSSWKSNLRFVLYASYDKNEDEVLFMTNKANKRCLAYQNKYKVFSSFYDYTGWVSNLGRHSINITGGELYFLREADDYNKFYGIGLPYWVSFIASPLLENGNSPSDCIFDNVWYRADVLDQIPGNYNNGELIIYGGSGDTWSITFDLIDAENDYQHSTNYPSYYASNFKFIKKFRMWRVPVPRQDRARMRNSWLKVRLYRGAKNGVGTEKKMVLRDIYVDSFF